MNGGISSQFTLPWGSSTDVRLEVIACLKYLARGGGYIIGPTKSILPETPKENIIALFETILDQPTRPQDITDVFPDHVIDLEKVYNSFH